MKGKISSTMIVLVISCIILAMICIFSVAAILEKIQEKIEANHPVDPFDLKGLDRTKEV